MQVVLEQPRRVQSSKQGEGWLQELLRRGTFWRETLHRGPMLSECAGILEKFGKQIMTATVESSGCHNSGSRNVHRTQGLQSLTFPLPVPVIVSGHEELGQHALAPPSRFADDALARQHSKQSFKRNDLAIFAADLERHRRCAPFMAQLADRKQARWLGQRHHSRPSKKLMILRTRFLSVSVK